MATAFIKLLALFAACFEGSLANVAYTNNRFRQLRRQAAVFPAYGQPWLPRTPLPNHIAANPIHDIANITLIILGFREGDTNPQTVLNSDVNRDLWGHEGLGQLSNVRRFA